MLLFLVTFTFFLSSVISAIVEKNKVLVNLGVFVTIILAGILSIPQVKMAVSLLNPETLPRLPSTSLMFSLFTAAMTLVVVGVLVFGAKGTLLSDLFWYSVKNMRRRMLRTILTLLTITVISAVSGSLLAVGTVVNTREVAYPSAFRGVSVSSHVTVETYIYRGMDGGAEVTVEESFEPIPESQVEWLSSLEWVERRYVVVASRVLASKGGRLFRALLVVTNASKLNGVAVSTNLAKDLDVKEGDCISIDGMNIYVSKILDGNLILMDGVPFDELKEQYLVVAGFEYLHAPMTVYRLLLEGNVPPALRRGLSR